MFTWIWRPASATLSGERVSLDIEWSKETSGKRKVTRNQLVRVFRADPDPPEYIMEDVFARAGKILEPFKSQENQGNVPSPAFSLQVSNVIQPESNLYAIQKTFNGPFQFDIFYESASANHKLDGTMPALRRP